MITLTSCPQDSIFFLFFVIYSRLGFVFGLVIFLSMLLVAVIVSVCNVITIQTSLQSIYLTYITFLYFFYLSFPVFWRMLAYSSDFSSCPTYICLIFMEKLLQLWVGIPIVNPRSVTFSQVCLNQGLYHNTIYT